ncbi:hypothetical protein HIM_05277 [Hirsutella minnesotensis 3608]|uniref:Beta-lactamase-related domain-containing protein n=1 Tax=Hirsutella minnesotensis 3608 TaxID=1043627 RepID=A0A0F7ZKL1_9HYPO|nr:hypothetical protein HIM_05277 [Hirsutella minnesotensis 3608]
MRLRQLIIASLASGAIVKASELHVNLPVDSRSADQAPLRSPETTSENPFTKDFKDYVKQVMKDWKVPGMSIAVVDGDQVFAEGFGYASFPDKLASPETLYWVGSTTKAHLAATLAQLIDSGAHPELSRGWNTPISSIIRDDFVLKDDWATAHLTLADAVSHRTGMTRHDASWHKQVNGKNTTVKDVVRNLRNLPPLTFEPRTRWYYCNLMYVTLAHVVETVVGKWLGDVMKEVIWHPLGMKTTYLSLDEALRVPVDIAKSYAWKEDTQEYIEMSQFPSLAASGAGGIISNVVDYAKWLQCLIHEAEPFSANVHKDIKTPRMILNPSPGLSGDMELYGLGWSRMTIHGAVAYEHGGSTLTFGAEVYWFPELKYGLVAFANSDDTSNEVESIVLQRMIGDKLQVPLEKRPNVDKKLKESRKANVQRLENAKDILFPRRPEKPSPPSLEISQLAGSYMDSGYGLLRLAPMPHPRHTHETILVANRTEFIFEHQLQLHHVSGDYWIAYFVLPGELKTQTKFFASRFIFGADGQASSLEIDLYDQGTKVREGVVTFEKIN